MKKLLFIFIVFSNMTFANTIYNDSTKVNLFSNIFKKKKNKLKKPKKHIVIYKNGQVVKVKDKKF